MSEITKSLLDLNNKTIKVHTDAGVLAIPISQLIDQKIDEFDTLFNALILLPSIFEVVEGSLIIPNLHLCLPEKFGVI